MNLTAKLPTISRLSTWQKLNFHRRAQLSTQASPKNENEKAGGAKETPTPNYMQLSETLCKESESFKADLFASMSVHDDFVSDREEESIFREIDPYLKRMRYEFDHWDNAIHGYRETERSNWNSDNQKILDKVRKFAFPADVLPLKYVHILDLDKSGYIKPHIDAIRFCGDTIAGLSLLSDSVMRLVHDKRKDVYVDVLLRRRSLYVMKKTARFDYTHEILKNELSVFGVTPVEKTRRVSVICRNEPDPRNVT